MRNVEGLKFISVARLKSLLDRLPPGLTLCPNAVGNLLIMGAHAGEQFGYIDFGNETLELDEIED